VKKPRRQDMEEKIEVVVYDKKSGNKYFRQAKKQVL
jgi:hypothetical protein